MKIQIFDPDPYNMVSGDMIYKNLDSKCISRMNLLFPALSISSFSQKIRAHTNMQRYAYGTNRISNRFTKI